jgi:hypothetical protein
MSSPSALLNSLNELKGTTQRASAPSHAGPVLATDIDGLALGIDLRDALLGRLHQRKL